MAAAEQDISVIYNSVAAAPKKGKARLKKSTRDANETPEKSGILTFDDLIAACIKYTVPQKGVYISSADRSISVYYQIDTIGTPPTLQFFQVSGNTRKPIAPPSPELASTLYLVPPTLYAYIQKFSTIIPAAELAPRYAPSLPETPWVTAYDDGIRAWNVRSPGSSYALLSSDVYPTYMKHLRETIKFSNGQIDTLDLSALPALEGNVNKVRGYETIRKILLHCKQTPGLQDIWNTYVTYSLIRNVIDFLHDYVHEGVKILGSLLLVANNSIPNLVPGIASVWLNAPGGLIFNAITAGGKVNQTVCKGLSNNIAEEFKNYLSSEERLEFTGINKWLVTPKGDALITTASKDNAAEIAALLATAYTNGCRGIYIESLMTSATRLFSQIPALDMVYYDVASGQWDAGSGISYAEAARARPGLQRIILSRGPTNIPGTTSLSRSINAGGSNAPYTLGDTAVGGFGLFPIYLDENTGTLSTSTAAGNIKLVGRQRLSVNGLLKSVGLPGVRGSGEAGDVITFKNDAGADIDLRPAVVDNRLKLAALCIKQWTDTIQTDDIVNSEQNVLAVYSDYDAEEYCAMIGGTSILQRGNSFAYYCYDLTKRQVSLEELNRKRKTLLWARTNVASITAYATAWYEIVKTALVFMLNDTDDPSIFFAALSTLQSISNMIRDDGVKKRVEAYTTDVNINDFEQVATSSTTGELLMTAITNVVSYVARFEETYNALNTIMDTLLKTRAARLDPVEFLKKYGDIEQGIINALPTSIPPALIDPIVALFFAYGFLLPFSEVEGDAASINAAKERAVGNIIVSLDSTIADADADTAQKLINIKKYVLALKDNQLFYTPFITMLGTGIPDVKRILSVPDMPALGGGRRRRRRNRKTRGRPRRNRTRKH